MNRLILEDFIPYRLNRIGAAISEQLRGVYGRKYGLTVPEWRVLATLGQFERLTAKAIGAHSSMHKAKVSRAVRALEERRWLARSQNPNDRREEYLVLTSAGHQAYAAVIPDMMEFQARLRRKLGAGKTSAVLAALDALEGALSLPARKR